ncbi:MAG: hypothetical protein IT306_10625 [Chloroflexi bacterium]|nr:hypothetical protein [Chloroflexota bacterium]
MTELIASISRNPFDPAAIAGAWIVLLTLGFAIRRCLRRVAIVEIAVWWYVIAGLMEWSLFTLRHLENRGDVAMQMETPVISIMLGTISYTIMSLIWPLFMMFVTTWFSAVPEVLSRIIGQAAISQAVAALVAPVVTLLLRRRDRRSAARQERLGQG